MRARAALVAAQLLVASIARGEGSKLPASCDGARVNVEAALAPRWSRTLPSVCELVRGLADADSSAQLSLRPNGKDLIVIAALPDGRRAERRLRDPEDLLATVEALFVVPPSLADEQTQPKPEESASAPESRSAASDMHAGGAAKLELGGNLVSRVDGHPTYVSIGAEAYAGVLFRSFLLAVALRWDGYQTAVRNRPKHLEMSTEGGGLWAMYRLAAAKNLRLDAGLTFWLLGMMQTRGEEDDERGGNTFDLRNGAMIRALLGHGSIRTAIGADVELSPLRLRNELRLDRELPTLPSWSVGLHVGIAWEA